MKNIGDIPKQAFLCERIYRLPETAIGRCFFYIVGEIFETVFDIVYFAINLLYEKFNQKLWRWLGTLGYLYFRGFVIFSSVMAFCK